MDSEFRLIPEQASTIAPRVDALYYYLTGVSAFFTLLIAALIVYFAVKYRRGSAADRSPTHTHFLAIEVTWIVVPFLLVMIMFFWGARLYFEQSRPPAGAMQIDVVGRQWMWKLQHPEGNAEINELHVPRGTPVVLNLVSEDVIHSFYVPAFRIKHDVVPGRYTSVWFEATKVGQYHLFCAEYCGAKHSEMVGTVYVMEPSDYQAWLVATRNGPAPAEAGRQLFEQLRCNTCHRPFQPLQRVGEEGLGPPLEGVFASEVVLQDGRVVLADQTYLRESILRPAAKTVAGYTEVPMPSYEGQLTEEQVLQLIAYLKSLGRQQEVVP